ncbi:enolase [Actinoallomurus iriomotensis]|uniref:Enolase n=2 Tax=Actinoallomurus iriomotensis TaxID=478107 RepID=A0A9W6RDE2_9ACTN|nr:enolase [Actinoallomurus iriomotensis]
MVAVKRYLHDWGLMRISEVRTYTLKLAPDDEEGVYLGRRRDGGALAPDDGYVIREPWRSLYSARYETVLVELVTESGVSGWGEALAPVGPEIVQTAIDTLLAPQLLGADPRQVRPVSFALRELMRERGHLVGHQADALAAVDIALWDLAGRSHGLPVAVLLGGAYRDRLPCYVSGLPVPTDAERARLAADWAGHGVTAIKLHLGHGVEADLATYDTVAAAAPGVRVAVDAHWAYDRRDAIRLGRALDERGALFLEAPLPPEDVAGHAELQGLLATPVAVGETLRNRYEFDQWLGARALSVAQPDVGRTGITEAMAIAELAAARHLPVAPHHSVGLAVSLAAGLHVAAAVENLLLFEYQPSTLRAATRILREPLDLPPDAVPLPTGPGLGVDVDAEFVRREAVSTTSVKEG